MNEKIHVYPRPIFEGEELTCAAAHNQESKNSAFIRVPFSKEIIRRIKAKLEVWSAFS